MVAQSKPGDLLFVERMSCEAVADAGLDFHAACERVPHSKRPGTLLRYLRARNWNQESETPEGTSLEPLEFALRNVVSTEKMAS